MKPRKIKLICHLEGAETASVKDFSIACRGRLDWIKRMGYIFSSIKILNSAKDGRVLTFTDQIGLNYLLPVAIILELWQKES